MKEEEKKIKCHLNQSVNESIYLSNFSKDLFIAYSLLWARLAQCYHITRQEALSLQNRLSGVDEWEPVENRLDDHQMGLKIRAP